MKTIKLYDENGKPVKKNWLKLTKEWEGREKECDLCNSVIPFPMFTANLNEENYEEWACHTCGNRMNFKNGGFQEKTAKELLDSEK